VFDVRKFGSETFFFSRTLSFKKEKTTTIPSRQFTKNVTNFEEKPYFSFEITETRDINMLKEIFVRTMFRENVV